MEEAGVNPYDIPAQNYHIISYNIPAGRARTAITQQKIILHKHAVRENMVSFGLIAFHETLHAKGNIALFIDKEKANLYRTGLKTENRGPEDLFFHFEGLDEAVIAEATRKFFPKLLELPELSKEKKWLISKAKEKGLKLGDEIYWIRRDGGVQFTYGPHRKILDYVCTEIQKQFPEKDQSADNVFKVFLKAHFTGRLLPIARLVEKTFGKGSFRVLSSMGIEDESCVRVEKSLRKMRTIQIKKENKKWARLREFFGLDKKEKDKNKN